MTDPNVDVTNKVQVQTMDCPHCGKRVGYVSNEWMGERVELIGIRGQSLYRNAEEVVIKVTHTFQRHHCTRKDTVSLDQAFDTLKD